ncbi:MAG TPA: hypothetical protein VJC08_04000, partial [bacterium]|nr:hypothetical protein [bacterium]
GSLNIAHGARDADRQLDFFANLGDSFIEISAYLDILRAEQRKASQKKKKEYGKGSFHLFRNKEAS